MEKVGLPAADQRYTYKDYLQWPDDIRVELIHGKIIDMSAAPGRTHQQILIELSRQIANFLLNSKTEVFAAPFDVRFPTEGEGDYQIENVVQPDICVICDPAKLDERGCLGAPDLVIEILSPSTSFKDLTDKMKLYEEHGVKEYWIVNPVTWDVAVYTQKRKGTFEKPVHYNGEEVISSLAVEGLQLELTSVFSA
jgi:Uma2 family endonuclease